MVVIVLCLSILHPVIGLLVAGYLYWRAHRAERAALKRQQAALNAAFRAAQSQPQPDPTTALERRFRLISGGRP